MLVGDARRRATLRGTTHSLNQHLSRLTYPSERGCRARRRDQRRAAPAGRRAGAARGLGHGVGRQGARIAGDRNRKLEQAAREVEARIESASVVVASRTRTMTDTARTSEHHRRHGRAGDRRVRPAPPAISPKALPTRSAVRWARSSSWLRRCRPAATGWRAPARKAARSSKTPPRTQPRAPKRWRRPRIAARSVWANLSAGSKPRASAWKAASAPLPKRPVQPPSSSASRASGWRSRPAPRMKRW